MIVELTKKIDEVVAKNQDLILDEANNQKRDLAISSADELQKVLNEIKEEGKTLKIGIVGRVKAGKSSLLNALIFNGDSILPKAATPMTAALTILEYSDTLQAEVEFFTKEDIEDIKTEAINFEKKLNNLINEKFEEAKNRKLKKQKTLSEIELNELKEKAVKQANRALKDENASFDQYQRIKNSGVDVESLEQFKTITADDTNLLSQELVEYVGSNGKYMPFTKSVTIKLPNETLKDLEIIDTPGVNDPVVSREERTRELLKYCDVILVVSPSGQFLSSEDMDLMDRITTKEGIRELFVVASQVDNQLFGSEKEKFNGVLPDVLNGITNRLGEHMATTLTKLKKVNPEVGNVFDKLIEDGKNKVLHSSGLSFALKQNFDNQESWDDGMKKVWENLTREYPDYFSSNKEISSANLDLLANIEKIDNIIDDVRVKKETILKEKQDNFIKTKTETLEKYKQNLISYVENQIERIENSDIDEIKNQKEKLASIQTKASRKLDEEFYELVEELDINIKNEMMGKLKSFFRSAKDDINEAEGEGSETTYSTIRTEQSGAFGGAKRFFGSIFGQDDWGYDEEEVAETDYYTTARAGAIRNSLENLTDSIESEVEDKAKTFILSWRKSVYSRLVKTLREAVGDEDLDVDIIKSTIRNIVNSVEYPEIDYSGGLPSHLKRSGVLKGYDAEEYLDDARDYVSDLKERVTKDIKKYRKQLVKSLQNQQLSNKIFAHYKKEIEKLEEEINTKELTLEKYNNLLTQFKGM